MAERKPIPQKKRFEVFKRDAFRCQYCGRSSPDVILEIDHVVPVAGGGGNDMLNLITACRDCNGGKGKRRLSDNTEVIKQRQMLEELNEKRNQVEMMIRWKEEMRNIAIKQADEIEKLIIELTGEGLIPPQLNEAVRWIREFGFCEVYEAAEIAMNKYYERLGVYDAFSKIGGICYNRKNGIKGGNRHGQ